MFGKWHLGEDPAHHPSVQGFDEAMVSAGQHFRFKTNPRTDVPEGAYLADFLTDRAEQFLEDHRDGPFFLYLPHFGVHSPHQAKPDQIARFENKAAAGGHDSPVYAAMIASVDESVGRVIAKLDALGLTGNTLVIFSSDNGGVGGYDREGIKRTGGITDNAPLRGGKGMLYEGGVRVPFITRWPGKIAPGRECREPILSVDLLPTLAALAGAPLPDQQPVDGVNLAPLFDGDESATLGREAIYWHFPGYLGAGRDAWRTTPAGAIRSGDYKLLEFFEDGRIELYNLREDLSQQHDLAKEQPELAAELARTLREWRKSVQAPMPSRRLLAR
jgi:arylsulfatase A-like enzyme